MRESAAEFRRKFVLRQTPIKFAIDVDKSCRTIQCPLNSQDSMIFESCTGGYSEALTARDKTKFLEAPTDEMV